MFIRAFHLIVAVLLLSFPLNAYANTYAQFSGTRLFCVVVPGNTNYLSTIPVSGAVTNHTVSKILNESLAQKSRGQKILRSLKSKVKSATGKRKAKLQKQIKAGKLAMTIIKNLITFSKQCRDHVLDSSAIPYIPGGGGGGKK